MHFPYQPLLPLPAFKVNFKLLGLTMGSFCWPFLPLIPAPLASYLLFSAKLLLLAHLVRYIGQQWRF